MKPSKIQGFSLIELLVTIALASLVLVLFLQNLSTFGLKSIEMQQEMESQDEAITALILLKHQIAAAALTECTNEPSKIEDLSGSTDFSSLTPFHVFNEGDPLLASWNIDPIKIENNVNAPILLHQLSETFYASHPREDLGLLAPSEFSGQPNALVVVDDCHHALIAPIENIQTLYAQGKLLTIRGFNQENFQYPVSVSLIKDRVYFLGQTKAQNGYALFRAYRAKDGRIKPEEMIPHLSAVQFKQSQNLEILVAPQYGHEVYHVTL